MLDYLFAALLGVIEGITEWLPISSTGHLILADEFIHMSTSDAFKEMFDVVIQFGAILAVVVIFWSKLWPFRINRDACGSGVSGLVDRYCRKDVWDMWFHVLVAIVPSAVIGLPLDDWMTEHLHNPPVVSAMLILYGVVFIVLERRNRRRLREAEAALEAPRGRHARVSYGDAADEAEASLFKITDVDEIDWKTALKIGCFQVLAIIPGTSRSGATIIGGMLSGCSRTAAAEFTFFLAVPTMAGASLVKVVKFLADGGGFSGSEVGILLTGCAVAFAVSMLCIRFLMNYVKKHDFKVFGWYRIGLGALVLAYFYLLKPAL